MTIKLIALDLDGTTLNSAGKLSEGNRNALERAAQKGVNVVIATGRCYGALPEDVVDVGGIRYAITSNGAQIRDLHTGEALYSNCIAPDSVVQAERILREYEERDFMAEVFVDGVAYMEKQIYDDVKAGRNAFRHRDYVVNTRNPVDGLLDFLLAHKDNIENINIFFASMDEKGRCILFWRQ